MFHTVCAVSGPPERLGQVTPIRAVHSGVGEQPPHCVRIVGLLGQRDAAAHIIEVAQDIVGDAQM